MELGIFILGLIAALGTFSLYKNGKKKAILMSTIQDFIDDNNSSLVAIAKPNDSGPFNDEYFDEQAANLYHSVGYQQKETIYRKITFKTADGTEKLAWLQLRVENLKATYFEWRE